MKARILVVLPLLFAVLWVFLPVPGPPPLPPERSACLECGSPRWMGHPAPIHMTMSLFAALAISMSMRLLVLRHGRPLPFVTMPKVLFCAWAVFFATVAYRLGTISKYAPAGLVPWDITSTIPFLVWALTDMGLVDFRKREDPPQAI